MDSLHWDAVRGACPAACTVCVILPRPSLWFLTFFFLDCKVRYGTICLCNTLLQHLQWTEVFQLFPWRWFHLNFSPPVSFIWNTNAGRSSFCIRGWTCFCCFWFQHRIFNLGSHWEVRAPTYCKIFPTVSREACKGNLLAKCLSQGSLSH